MRDVEIQLKARSRIIRTREGQALTFCFSLGPVQVFIIANMPTDNEGEPLAYIKLNFKTDESWHFRKTSI